MSDENPLGISRKERCTELEVDVKHEKAMYYEVKKSRKNREKLYKETIETYKEISNEADKYIAALEDESKKVRKMTKRMIGWHIILSVVVMILVAMYFIK